VLKLNFSSGTAIDGTTAIPAIGRTALVHLLLLPLPEKRRYRAL